MLKKNLTEETLIQLAAKPRIRHHPSLIVIRGQDIGFRTLLSRLPVNIGRSEMSEICFPDSSVSRHHCQIWQKDEEVCIRDLGATNTTRVNEVKISEVVLQDGDIIGLGKIVLKYLGPDSLESEYHDTLYQLATEDGLCGLPNRRYFMEQLEREVHRSIRHKNPQCLLMLDIDHFKLVNDRYGHAAGDKVLLAISQCIKGSIRDDDLCARLGGEEFAILLPETVLNDANEYAERLLAKIQEIRVRYKGSDIRVTVSIGVSCWNTGLQSADEFLHNADTLLYQAKNAGRNCIGSASV